MDLKRIKDKIHWELNLEREFYQERKCGYSFVIDVYEGRPFLALYRMTLNYSSTTPLDIQPPVEMMVRALIPQAGAVIHYGLYHIDSSIRNWIEENTS
ncbi:MAG: hypothetical protein H0Z40_02360 [Desulfotomaculum sp.]|nr:hypothetical protein [Desulfotomaculum sp.]